MKHLKFIEKIHIACSPEQAFDYTQDYNNRLHWDTFLKRAELTNGATAAGVGVSAYCVAKNGMGMITEYVSYNRPKATATKMTQGPFMFRSFAGSWTFAETQKGITEVTFTYSFQLRFPLSLAAGLAKRILQQNVGQRLIDLKRAIEGQ